MSEYLLQRLEKEESPIYLHELADFIMVNLNRHRGPAMRLQRKFRSVVAETFKSDDLRPELKEMSLYRAAQILRAMPTNR